MSAGKFCAKFIKIVGRASKDVAQVAFQMTVRDMILLNQVQFR